jgi:hypothetical protein
MREVGWRGTNSFSAGTQTRAFKQGQGALGLDAEARVRGRQGSRPDLRVLRRQKALLRTPCGRSCQLGPARLRFPLSRWLARSPGWRRGSRLRRAIGCWDPWSKHTPGCSGAGGVRGPRVPHQPCSVRAGRGLLRRGWLGLYVTTGVFSKQAQVEVISDQYPVVLVPGKTLSEEVREIPAASSDGDLQKMLAALIREYPVAIMQRCPEEILHAYEHRGLGGAA